METSVADTIWSIIAAIGGFGMIGVIFYFILNGREDRDRDEEARAYFDAHGRWPDEG